MDTQGVKPDAVDINKLVQEMKAQGLSKAQASGMITSVMGSVTQNFQNAPVASKRKSDTPVDASVPSDFNPGSKLVALMNEAWGPEEDCTPRSGPAGPSFATPDAMFEETVGEQEQQAQTANATPDGFTGGVKEQQEAEAVPEQVARTPEQQRQTSLDFSSIGFDEAMFSIQGVLGKDTIEIPYRST
jgi:hypothetical protein